MSYADKIFVNMCNDILEKGTNTKGQKVRPHWQDGSLAYTIKKFGVINRYDLRKEFPVLTIRPTGIKSAFDEILWIFQRKSNNINDLKPHIWDEWADENGSIGKAYGYQVAQKYLHHTEKYTIKDVLDDPEKYPINIVKACENNPDDASILKYEAFLDQIDAVIYDLKNTPFSRRIMTSIWNFEDLHEMNLQPCCWSCTFNVTEEREDGKLTLNMILNQRSNDVLAANNWNVVQYALLQMMIAQCVGMEAGELVHVIADAHIYDRHVDIIKEIISRPQYDAPIVKLNPEITDFYKFTTDDIIIENYKHGDQVKFEVAV